ncbi:TIR domain-containing protein [Streptomyces noursei]|uniref:TIR domain-containing protein n=1 Tax=Streptomyces noursei TaxID=1971 RepID=UPI001F330260|nr:TIR domain-containing protein [Streptomyces noursei]MCE4942328.1 TIR domain-containing protein [Streptomyces noursei]
MPEVFVNYRTGDEEATATLIERELSHRFGSDRIFRASKSIPGGQPFPRELITAARRSSVLLAVIGPRWLEARTADGRPALADPKDWIRREILEAFGSGSQVIPILVGRTDRLAREVLPPVLRHLADCQYRRLDHRNVEADLSRLGDELAQLVPELADADRNAPRADAASADPEGHSNRSGEVRGNSVQAHSVTTKQRGGIGNVGGDFSGTFISEPRGPLHTGSGDQYDLRDQSSGPRFTGDGMGVSYVAGDNSGTVEQPPAVRCREGRDQ